MTLFLLALAARLATPCPAGTPAWTVIVRPPAAKNRVAVTKVLQRDKIAFRVIGGNHLAVCADTAYALDVLAEKASVEQVRLLRGRERRP